MDAITRSFRIPAKLYKRISEIANKRCISRNSLIVNTLWDVFMKEEE
jgi:predicted transcriptional regulator